MKLAALLIIATLAFTQVASLSPEANEWLLKQEFNDFKTKFGKSYENELEESRRFDIFKENVERIAQKNLKATKATFGITKFADLTQDEFKFHYLTYVPRPNKDTSKIEITKPKTTSVPTSFDWRDQSGVVTDVKNQGGCGSCWAFSATETIESAWALAGNTLVEFAPQQIVSCDTTAYGCGGGWTESAYEYVESAGGMALESDYPYTSGNPPYSSGTCESFTVSGGDISGYTYATSPCTSLFCNNQDEDTLIANLASVQPVSICVDASEWSYYTGGVFTNADGCSSSYYSQDHCVQLVGYQNYDSDSGDSYYMVRNSWGTDWGYDGYIYLSIGDNTCGIADDATQVTIA